MAYADLADVQALMAQITIDGSSRPTSTQVTNVIIPQVSAEIDGVLAARGLTVPVTTPAYFLEALTLLNAMGSAAAVIRSMKPVKAGASEGSASYEAFYADWYQKGLRRLESGTGIPDGLATSGAGVGPSTYFTRNPDEEEDLGDIAEPFFTRGMSF
jgi:hypothetical protein